MIGKATPFKELRLPDRYRELHVRVAGEPGTGKTVLGAWMVLQDVLRGIPTIVIDGSGALTTAFIQLALALAEGRDVLKRFVYFPVRKSDYTHGFPFWVRDERWSSYEHSQILIETLLRITPGLEAIGAPTFRHVGSGVALALYEAGYQVTEATRFLEDKQFRAYVLRRVGDRLPDVAGFFLRQFNQWPERRQSEISFSFYNKVSAFGMSPELRAIVGQDRPTVPFERLEAERLVMFVDLGGSKEFPVQVIASVVIDRLSQYLFAKRISECQPLGLYIDEAAALLEHQGIAKDFREFQSRARQYRLWLTVMHQSMHQLEESLRSSLWSVATQIIFRQLELESGLEVARNMVPADPYMAKYPPASLSGNPTAMPVSEQMWSYANWLQNLPNRRCVVRTVESGGLLGREGLKVRVMTTPTLKFEHIPDHLVEDVKQGSLRRYGRPVADALKEVTERQNRHLNSSSRPLREEA